MREYHYRNRVDLIGDVETTPTRLTTARIKVKFKMLTIEESKDQFTGEKKPHLSHHEVFVAGDEAKAVLTDLKKGDKVHVEGALQYNPLQANLNGYYTTITAFRVSRIPYGEAKEPEPIDIERIKNV